MANRNHLLKQLVQLAEIERGLWLAFQHAETQAYVKPYQMIKLFQMRRHITASKNILIKQHPLLVLLAGLSAILVPAFTDIKSIAFVIGVTVYSGLLLSAMLTRDRFIEIYSKSVLRSERLVDQAFGIDKVSLLVFTSFEKDSFPKNLHHGQIGKLIKLVKAGQDHQSISYGYQEFARKALIAALFALPITGWSLLQGENKGLSEVKRIAVSAYNNNPNSHAFLVTIALLLLLAISVIIYSLAFGDQKRERQKKRYLLWLNLLYESWLVNTA